MVSSIDERGGYGEIGRRYGNPKERGEGVKKQLYSEKRERKKGRWGGYEEDVDDVDGEGPFDDGGQRKDQKLPPHQTGMNATQRRERGRKEEK